MTDLHTYTRAPRRALRHTFVYKKNTHTFHSTFTRFSDHTLTHSCSSWVRICSRRIAYARVSCASNVRRLSAPKVFSTCTHLHTLTYTLSCSTGQDVSQVATCLLRICLSVYCCYCVCVWVCVCFTLLASEKMLTVKDRQTHTHTHTHRRQTKLYSHYCGLQGVTMAMAEWNHGLWERRCVCVCVCVYVCTYLYVCVSYRPRSGWFPQEVSYSPQANQRTKFETEFNPIGPALMTFIVRGQSQESGQPAGQWHHS